MHKYARLDPETLEIIRDINEGKLSLTEDLAEYLLDLLASKKPTAIEALDILDALYGSTYMPAPDYLGNHEKWLQDQGYKLTPEDVDYLDPLEAQSILYNLFYNGADIYKFVQPVLPLLVKKALRGPSGEDFLRIIPEEILQDLNLNFF